MAKTHSKLANSLGLFLLLVPLAGTASTSVSHMQVMTLPSYTRIIFSINEPDHYHVFSLSNPHRVVVDFDNARLRADTHHADLSGSPITNIRNGNPKPTTMRIVFDLDSAVHYRSYLSADNVHEAKLVVDIFPTGKAPRVAVEHPVAPLKHIAEKVIEKPIEKLPVKVAEISRPHTMMVVIDPGHGGKDPGTIGPHGTKEKDVVLGIALRLADLINQEPNMHAILTRKTDHFVTLRNRLHLARNAKADMFISIHADAYQTQQSTGASVYALSHHGASSEAARWLAQQENNSELAGVDLDELRDKSYVLRSVLIDLAQTATIKDSLRLGTNVLESLQNITTLHYPRVEQAPFVVLKSPDIPSILVETGYLSNSSEEEHLREPEYREKMAKAMLSGVKQYLVNHSTVGI